MSVSITKSISVHNPKANLSDDEASNNKVVTLSNLDRQCPILMYMVFFYKQSLCNIDSVFDRLKAGLEATLSVCEPAAGRFRFSSNDGKFDILCNNGGATLVQAISGLKISELGDLSLYNEYFENLVFKPDIISDGTINITEMPLVTAQVTKFECGGYSIGIGTSHSLFDGKSAYEFLRAWATNCNNPAVGASELLYEPVHERGSLLLLAHDINNGNNNNKPSRTGIHHLYELIKQLHASMPHDIKTNGELISTPLVFKTFHLSNEMIHKLKKKVLTDGFSCSTFELLAAHLWKVRTKALGLQSNRKVCLQFAVDARNRMNPPLPKGFSGNAYVLASVVTTASELDENTHQDIIDQIKEAKNAVTHNYVTSYMKALELGGDQPQTTLPPLPELTIVSDWTRIPFHTVNFTGEEPSYASPLVSPIPQVAYFMQSPNAACEGSIDVRIGLLPSIQARFSHDFIDM